MAAIAFPKFAGRVFRPDPVDDWWTRSGSTWGRGVLYFAFTAGLALAAFLAGRNGQPGNPAANPKVKTTTVDAVWLPTETGKLDQSLVAGSEGRPRHGAPLANELHQTFSTNAALDAYLSMLDTREGRLNDVEASLSRRIGPATPPAGDRCALGGAEF